MTAKEEIEKLVDSYGLEVISGIVRGMELESKKEEQADNFDIYCRRYGLKPEHLGKRITLGASFYKIRGINTRNRKYPILVDRVPDGKGFKITAQEVLRSIETYG